MDRYQKVEKPKAETPINENELRITALGRMRNYISYAMTLLQEKGANEIVLKATGRAINKTVMIAELIKRRIAGLHQNTSTGSIDITDTWEPLEEGLLPYQPPIPTDQVKASAEIEGNEGGNINGGMVDHRNGGWDGGRGYGGRGQGCGRGHGSRGRGKGYGGEICSGIQDITTVMIHQDHCLARVVVDVGEDEDEDVVADLLVKVSDLMVHSRKLLEHLQKYGFKLKPNLWMAAGLYALFKALIANLIGKRPYLLFSRPQFLREIGR
ncbi:hypothetical protein ES319_D01G200300v1 [Gossypium barbadense]|uniref:DNA/RNA-binding protein Alba-like domain-containing protein n=1 Tax=Gossypium barbadense TaxID=3634 RepID=A0A5J5SRH7_GOSBA|nr:hypothetical protein ES319_D01G200300v1 [Gossypium barbadense]